MKKRNFDVLEILLGIIVGGFLGFFISSKFVNDTIETSNTNEENGFIYIVEINQYDNPNGANNLINDLSTKNIYAIYIIRDNYYYVYAGIYGSLEEANSLKETLLNLGYNAKVNKEYILDYTNNILDSKEKEFYDYCINCYLLHLSNGDYTVDYDTIDFEVNIELFQDISMLNNLTKESLIMKTRLQIYDLLTKIK